MSERIKRNNDELKADRPTISEVKFIPRLPISILVENVRSVHNVGSIFRSADGFGAGKIYLSGYTAHPPREDLHKTALGSENAVPWEYYENPLDAVKAIKNKGISLLLIEQTKQSRMIYETDWEFPICFIVGNEVTGVSEELSSMADIHAELPMRGIKQSLNVSVACGVVGYELARDFSLKN
ncbi:MAG: RNA methyltransferase [Candidatus Marinimicrobia bacterium]|nr:RNA methyltransferase [Candidatus Neomarinimicrobiota bacterium]